MRQGSANTSAKSYLTEVHGGKGSWRSECSIKGRISGAGRKWRTRKVKNTVRVRDNGMKEAKKESRKYECESDIRATDTNREHAGVIC